MSESGLRILVSSLVRLAEGSALSTEKEEQGGGGEIALDGVVVSTTAVDAVQSLKSHVSSLFTAVTESIVSPKSVSNASAAWFEIQLVEVALRNRDRFGAIWPALTNHYSRTLTGPVRNLSYVTERHRF